MKKHEIGFVFSILSFVAMIPMFTTMLLFVGTGKDIYKLFDYAFGALSIVFAITGAAIEYRDYRRVKKQNNENDDC